MRLTALEPTFLKVIDDSHFESDVSFADADGILFLCPKCFLANGGRVGTHSVICWRPPRVPQTIHPIPGRWEFEGSGFDDLTLKAGSSSILLNGNGCLPRLPDGTYSPGWHGFITSGEVIGA